jgi:putative ABC transport system permease protein
MSASAIAGAALAAAALVALASGNVGLLALGAVLFMTGVILVAPALVRPLSLGFGALFALLFARDGTGTLAQGNLTRQPSRAAVTASTTMIALAIIVALGGMTVSITQGFLGIMRRSLGSDYLFVPPAIGVWQNDVGANMSLAQRLRGIKGVGDLSTLRYAAAVAEAKPAAGKGAAAGPGVTVSLIGIDPRSFPLVSGLQFNEGRAGDAFAELAAGRALVVNPILAASAGVRMGDIVPFQTPEGRREYRVVGVASDFMNAKIATAFISQANLAQDFHKNEDVFIQLNLAAGADAKAAGEAIRAAARGYPQFSVVEGRAYFEEMKGIFSSVFAALYVLFGFLAIPSLLTMLNTLAIGVIERTREIGMLRAVGTTRRQLRRMVLAEALLLAAFGTAFGLLAGLYLGYLLVRAMAGAGFPLSYLFPWGGIVAAAVVGLLFGGLASIIPARKAARLEIVEALRYE